MTTNDNKKIEQALDIAKKLQEKPAKRETISFHKKAVELFGDEDLIADAENPFVPEGTKLVEDDPIALADIIYAKAHRLAVTQGDLSKVPACNIEHLSDCDVDIDKIIYQPEEDGTPRWACPNCLQAAHVDGPTDALPDPQAISIVEQLATKHSRLEMIVNAACAVEQKTLDAPGRLGIDADAIDFEEGARNIVAGRMPLIADACRDIAQTMREAGATKNQIQKVEEAIDLDDPPKTGKKLNDTLAPALDSAKKLIYELS